MSQIIKGYLGVFLVLLLMLTSVGVLSAFMGVISAQDVHGAIIDELENSAYARNVLEEAFDKTAQAGYQMEVTLYFDDGGSNYISSKEEIPANSMKTSYARVDLRFPLKIAFFQVNQNHVISGYAR